MKDQKPDPFALEVGNNEFAETIERFKREGKVVFRIEVAPHGYILRWHCNVRTNTDPLVELLLDFSADQ